MSLLPPTDDDYKYVLQVSRLFISGAMYLQEMLSKNDLVAFDAWASRFRDDTSQYEDFATKERLMWLWDVLRTEPELNQKFGSLPPAAAPWSGTNKRFMVFGPGEWFVIGLKRADIADLLKNSPRAPLEETVAVWTTDVLEMKPKGKRLECCDCHAQVTIRVTEVFSIDREADIMEIEKDRISLGDRIVNVRVDSLNQAYTVASRRLEPDRRSHGGRIYDHVVHLDQGNRTSLEFIRQSVENGEWKVPTKR